MTTRAEQLAQAFPLHYQRIVELAYAHFGPHFNEGMAIPPADTPFKTLAQMFHWDRTTEGHAYWSKLARGASC